MALNSRYQGGMTLLEVMLAVALISIISAMAFVGLNSLMQARESTKNYANEQDQLNLAMHLMREDVELVNVTSDISGENTEAFIGQSNEFLLTRMENNRQTGLPSQVIQVKWTWLNNRLVRSTRDALQPNYLNKWSDRYLLNLQNFNCSYATSSGDQVANWPSQTAVTINELPKAVFCQFKLTSGYELTQRFIPRSGQRY